MQCHFQTPARSKSYRSFRFNRLLVRKAQAIFLRDCRNNKLSFHQREVVADALSRTAAKREVSETRASRDFFRQEMFGVKFFGLLPILRMAMRDVGTFIFIVLLAVLTIQLGLDIVVAHTIKTGHWSSLCLGAIMGYVLSRYPKET